MIRASELKVGTVLHQRDDFLKVISIDFAGAAKNERSLKIKLKNLLKGNLLDAHYKSDDPLQEAELTTVKMEFLYEDGESFVFMDHSSYEQVPVPASQIGNGKAFLAPNMEVSVALCEGKPIQVLFPKMVALEVVQAPQGTGETDSTYKEVELDNGLKVLTPQFIKTGDRIHVDVETGKYVDRIKKVK